MDPSPLVPGGLPFCGPLHPGQDLKISHCVCSNYSIVLVLLCNIKCVFMLNKCVCVPGGRLRVGQ